MSRRVTENGSTPLSETMPAITADLGLNMDQQRALASLMQKNAKAVRTRNTQHPSTAESDVEAGRSIDAYAADHYSDAISWLTMTHNDRLRSMGTEQQLILLTLAPQIQTASSDPGTLDQYIQVINALTECGIPTKDITHILLQLSLNNHPSLAAGGFNVPLGEQLRALLTIATDSRGPLTQAFRQQYARTELLVTALGNPKSTLQCGIEIFMSGGATTPDGGGQNFDITGGIKRHEKDRAAEKAQQWMKDLNAQLESKSLWVWTQQG